MKELILKQLKLNPIRAIALVAYIISAIITLILLPDGIIASTNIYDSSAVSMPTIVYLIIMLIVFIIATSSDLRWGRSGRLSHGPRVSFFARILVTAGVMLVHILFIKSNIG